ncbi:MAG: hexose kinase [Verrucomicrobiota bacterium]
MNPLNLLCLGTTPAAQRVMVFRKLSLDAVNRAASTLDGAAGKSINVAKVLQSLGEHPVAIGFLGGDRGDFIRARLAEAGIEHEFVTVSTRTRQCVTVIDESAGTQTELVEESAAVRAPDVTALLDVLRRRLPAARALILSGTVAPGCPPDFYHQCAVLACEAGVPAILDAQGPALFGALPAKPWLVKPNRAELAASFQRPLPDDASVRRAMRELHEGGAAQVVITDGKKPALATDGRRSWKIFAPEIQAVNPIGSGDAFTAALSSRLLHGDDLGAACRWACAAGAANALTLMAGEIDPAEVPRLAGAVRVELQKP